MRYKSDSQRKAVMANLSERDRRFLNKNPGMTTASFKQIQKKGHYLKYHTDSDGDGVKNIKDCQPLNPKKQGLLHDINIKLLKRKEEKLERERERQQRKLEDLKDTLKERHKVASKKRSVQQAMTAQKQAIIDELSREKRKSEQIRKLNEKAQKELDKYTLSGKLKTGTAALSRKAAKSAEEFKERWNDPKNVADRKRKAKATGKFLKKLSKKIF